MMTLDTMVFVIDDDESLRKSLGRMLDAAHYSVELFESASEFLSRPAHPGPSCVIVDVQMPVLTGIQLQKTLIQRGREEQLVFITGHGDIPMSVEAMKAGAIGFLSKPFRNQDLIDAVNEGLASDREALKKLDELRELQERYESLTAREREVFALVTSGSLNKQVAQQLGTSERTIKAHRAQVVIKMHADSVADLVRMADRLGVVAPRR